MPASLLPAIAAWLALAQNSVETITCIPARYAQVQGGREYDRVDCASEKANPQCAARSYSIAELQVSPLAYSSSKELPPQGEEYLGRFHLLIDRGTGAFHFVVIATAADDSKWYNVKTFSGTCSKANGEKPL